MIGPAANILPRALTVAVQICARGADARWRRMTSFGRRCENEHGSPPEVPCGCLHTALSDADDASC